MKAGLLLALALSSASVMAHVPKTIRHQTCILRVKFGSEKNKPLSGFEKGIMNYILEKKNWSILPFSEDELHSSSLPLESYFLSFDYYKANHPYDGVILRTQISSARITTIDGNKKAVSFFEKQVDFNHNHNYSTYDYTNTDPSDAVANLIKQGLKTLPKCKLI